MPFAALSPTERLSLLPWLPDPDAVPLCADEADVLARARTLAGDVGRAVPVALQTPFSGLRVPAVDDQPACVTPPLAYWQARPDLLPTPAPPDLASALRRWQDAMDALALPPGLPFTRRYAAYEALAQTHARCLAVSGQPDIPLLQSRRLWSALAVCLWTLKQAGDDATSDATLALLVTDLSGIQSYLFGTTAFGVGGVARSLRARSFFLSQITALFAWRLLDGLGLPPGNLLMDAGGKFYVLFGATPAALAAVEAARCEAAVWCLNTLHGELALNIGYARFGLDALTGDKFGRVWQNANRAIALEKQRRLGPALQTEAGGWNTDAFLRSSPFEGGSPCRACGRFAQASGGKCRLCLRDVEIGKRLTRAGWLVYERGTGNGTDCIEAFGWQVQVGASDVPVPVHSHWAVRLEGAQVRSDVPLPVRRMARYVPAEADGRTPLTFEDMAAHAQGRAYLAYLKADVDRLGERFIFGFRQHEGGHSLPRISHLSQSLDWFFSGWLEQILRRDFPFCYTVFSGGDDLTIIGPHSQILALSRILGPAFRRFLGYGDGPPQSTDVLTLSAGIALATSRRPVASAVALAEHALELAKQGGRNRVCLLDRVLTWEAYERLMGRLWQPNGIPTPFGVELLETVPTAFVYHLLRYADMWQGYRSGRREQLHYQPLLAYDIGRNVDERKTPLVHDWAAWLAQIHLDDSGQWRAAMDALGALARLVILHRTGRG